MKIKIKDYDGQPVLYASPKRDGYWCEIKDGRIFGRKDDWTDKIRKNHEYLWRLVKFCQVKNFHLIGELYVPEGFATDVPNFLINGSRRLTWECFAWPNCPDPDIDIVDAMNVLATHGVPVVPVRPLTEEDTVEDLLEVAKKLKWEGWVLKQGHLDGWYKLKVTHTADVVITNWKFSDSLTYYGQLKSLEGSVYKNGELVKVCTISSGFTAEQKEMWTEDFCVGKVAEVNYQSVLSKGQLQFCSFNRWRDDKSPEECLHAQLDS